MSPLLPPSCSLAPWVHGRPKPKKSCLLECSQRWAHLVLHITLKSHSNGELSNPALIRHATLALRAAAVEYNTNPANDSA